MYFKTLPNVQYYSNLPDKNSSNSSTIVKNFFRRGKLRDDLFKNSVFFTKYSIIGDERPEQVSNKFYDTPLYDWVILLTNNILDVYNEWPLSQQAFTDYVYQKYKTDENLYAIKHYKTIEIKTYSGQVVQKKDLIVDETFFNKNKLENNPALEFYDEILGYMVTYSGSEITVPVTNIDYEEEINDKKRNIVILKQKYLRDVLLDLEDISTYKNKKSPDYITSSLKSTDNINISQP